MLGYFIHTLVDVLLESLLFLLELRQIRSVQGSGLKASPSHMMVKFLPISKFHVATNANWQSVKRVKFAIKNSDGAWEDSMHFRLMSSQVSNCVKCFGTQHTCEVCQWGQTKVRRALALSLHQEVAQCLTACLQPFIR